MKKLYNYGLQVFRPGGYFRYVLDHDHLYGVDYTFVIDKLPDYFPDFDRNGVPVKQDGSYNISGVCGYALAYWNEFLKSNDNRSRDVFLMQLTFLRTFTNFRYPSNLVIKELGAPWYSCLYQGLASSVFIRSFILSGNVEDKKIAKRCLEEIFSSDLALVSSLNGQIFLEEFPFIKPNHVLNGFLSAYIALLEYRNFTGDNFFDNVILACDKSLCINISIFDYNDWSLYDLSDSRLKNYATIHYHSLHIAQLEYIRYLSGTKCLDSIINSWTISLGSFPSRFSAMLLKLLFKVSQIL